jgi:hypothetical protein
VSLAELSEWLWRVYGIDDPDARRHVVLWLRSGPYLRIMFSDRHIVVQSHDWECGAIAEHTDWDAGVIIFRETQFSIEGKWEQVHLTITTWQGQRARAARSAQKVVEVTPAKLAPPEPTERLVKRMLAGDDDAVYECLTRRGVSVPSREVEQAIQQQQSFEQELTTKSECASPAPQPAKSMQPKTRDITGPIKKVAVQLIRGNPNIGGNKLYAALVDRGWHPSRDRTRKFATKWKTQAASDALADADVVPLSSRRPKPRTSN